MAGPVDTGNSEAVNRQQVYWQCRRGMLELDILLQDFFRESYDQLDVREKAGFSRMLDYPDAVLFELLMGYAASADGEIAGVIEKIRSNTDT
jgi:antitoxin CptB